MSRINAASPLSREEAKLAEEQGKNYTNAEDVELSWAHAASQFAESHYKLLYKTQKCEKLVMTPMDDVLLAAFQENFKSVDVKVFNEDFHKSSALKEIWRPLLMKFEHHIKDFHFATLMRVDATKPYGPENTCIVPRTQWYMVEIMRNRAGFNNDLTVSPESLV
eukprot:TRINITY_DN6039_c0_g1_i1.p1 TRINITY_DN6039_c0_g1~~TRINITY_DN6039_c0_g1_i1.p1  ORF type:complete len:164 (-),score=32.07 TRINITY_DN6039_c0_g1_i1:450-941(-)